VKLTKVQFKVNPDFIFGDNHVSSLRKLLVSIEHIQRQQLDVIEAKLLLDSWFYDSTETGNLQYAYNESELVNISEAEDYLGVSRTTLYKYIDRGLETVGKKHNQKVPRFLLEAWKNPELSFRMQWNAQLKRAREQTVEQRLDDVNQ
jgi:predicted DNA-binding transcriptional regulator AlpA